MDVELYIDEANNRYRLVLGADKVSLCRHHQVIPATCEVGAAIEIDTFSIPLLFTLNACGTGEFTPRGPIADPTRFAQSWAVIGVEVEEQLIAARAASAGDGRVYVIGSRPPGPERRWC